LSIVPDMSGKANACIPHVNGKISETRHRCARVNTAPELRIYGPVRLTPSACMTTGVT
jgi:hypothetical protein